MIYADDTDILSTDQIEKIRVFYAICEVFPERNLHINSDKEPWRDVKKLGSLLGDKEDITRRKQLSIAAVNNMEKVWIRKDYISEKHRLTLCRTVVKPVLLYENATWGLTKQDATKFHSFHRQQLRRLIGKSYPNKVSNKALYERFHEEPLSSTITRSQWQLFAHILRLGKSKSSIKSDGILLRNIRIERCSRHTEREASYEIIERH